MEAWGRDMIYEVVIGAVEEDSDNPDVKTVFGEDSFFLYGEGGAMTKYAKYVEGCGYTDGEKIIPLSEDEARDWVEEHMDVDDYIELFGECEE